VLLLGLGGPFIGFPPLRQRVCTCSRLLWLSLSCSWAVTSRGSGGGLCLFGLLCFGMHYGSEFIIFTLSGLFCLLRALFFLWFFHIFYIFQLNKHILLVLMWLSGTDFTVPDLVVAAFAKADHRMPGTAYSSGSRKLAAALPQKSVRTVFQLTALNYYYCWFLLYVFLLF
jgi:hypothetical protein